MNDIKPIKVSNDEYEGCTESQISRARELLIEMCDEDIIRSRTSCYA